MSFESGSVSFRAFMVPQPLPADIVSRVAAQAAPGLDSLRDEPVQGWVGGRHLLDRRITDDNAYYAGYLRLTLMQAVRKIPPALLKAEQTMEELAYQQANGLAFLNRKQRAEIRQEVVARLLPEMPPQLKGIHVVHDPEPRLVYATCLSEKQLDAFQIAFARATGFALIPAAPADLALRRKQIDVEELAPSSFSPDLEDREVGLVIGQDFLTWLWYMSESEKGAIALEDGRSVSVLIEGPLTFQMLGEGAHLAVLRKGMPMISAEAKSALSAGKKLKQAKCSLTVDEAAWSFTLDADDFVFRGMKLPESEERLDPLSRFQDRLLQLNRFMDVFFSLYDEFLARRVQPEEWREEVLRIRHWVQQRQAVH
jgi:hypothetical protein